MKTSLIKLFHSLGRKQAAKAMSKREGITQIPDVITSQGEGAAAYTTLREAGLTDDSLAKLINSEQDIIRLLNKVESISNQRFEKAVLDKLSSPPVLPMATITKFPKQGSGITGVKRLIKEGKIEDAWRKFDKGYKGNPADEKYFESFHPEAYKDSTKSKAFMGWKPSVVPKATNIPASKINHQMIADKYGIDVELIRGKDWIEVLEVIKKLGYAEGGIASIAPRKRYAKGSGRGRQDPMGGFAHQSTQEMREAAPDQFGGGMNISHGGGEGQNNNVISSPITNTGRTNYDFNLGDNALSPSFAFKYSPAKAANLRARIYNQNLSESDDINVDGSLSGTVGPVDYNTQFTDQGLGDTNLNYNNFSANIDPNKNYNIGYQTNRDGWNTGVNYDSDGRLMATIGTSFNKGGLAGILEV